MAEPAPFDDTMDVNAVAAAGMKLLMENPMFKVGEADIRGNTYRVFENAPKTLADLFSMGAASHGDKEFLSFQDERYTFAGLWAQSCRVANALARELGVKQGDRVAIAMRNYPEWIMSYMALNALGAVVVPLNAWWKGEELHYALTDSGAKLVIADARRLEHIEPFKEDLGLTTILAREESDGADHSFEALLAACDDETPPSIDVHTDDDFCVMYTSGSTGTPKGVVLTHRGCISTLFTWGFIATALKDSRGGKSLFGEDPGILLAIPLFHVTGSHSIFLLSYMVGRRVAMMYKWSAEDAAAIIRRERLTNFVGVPSQSFELMEAAGDEGLPSLVDIGSGGAKRPAEHVKKLAERFNHARPSSGYGLSETNAAGCIISLSEYQKYPDAAGRATPPVTDIKIVGDDGQELATGEVGEIWIRGPSNFRCYLNKPEETENALTADGWFRTGDLGKKDENDYIYIVDRIKDLIIRGGENISCLEVENAVYAHEDVAEACVFSVPDEVLGERVGVVVFPKQGVSIDAAALREFLAGALAGFKVPERIWISPGPLPRLATAKVDKINVRKMALQHPPAYSA